MMTVDNVANLLANTVYPMNYVVPVVNTKLNVKSLVDGVCTNTGDFSCAKLFKLPVDGSTTPASAPYLDVKGLYRYVVSKTGIKPFNFNFDLGQMLKPDTSSGAAAAQPGDAPVIDPETGSFLVGDNTTPVSSGGGSDAGEKDQTKTGGINSGLGSAAPAAGDNTVLVVVCSGLGVIVLVMGIALVALKMKKTSPSSRV